MLKIDKNEFFSQRFVYLVWMIMSFQAGYVNVGGFYTSGAFVSHVTGTSSNIGIGISKFDITFLLNFLVILIAFITGAAFSSYHISKKQDEGKEANYIKVLLIKSVFFFLVLLLSEMDILLPDLMAQTTVNTWIIFFLSFCCGIQNSTCAQATGGFLKPTHMTGLSTDIGINLAKYFKAGADNEKRKEELHKNNLRILILASFIAGGVIASLIFTKNGHYGFIFPFLSSLCFLGLGITRDKQYFKEYKLVQFTLKGSIIATFIITLLIGVRI